MLLTLIRPQTISLLSLICLVFAACASSEEIAYKGEVLTHDVSAVDRGAQLYAAVDMTVERSADRYQARAVVEVFDASGQPVAGAPVHGFFVRGAQQSAVTDARGIATFVSRPLTGSPYVAFHIDAVSHQLDGGYVAEEPAGLLYAEQCECGISTSSGSETGAEAADGISTSSGSETDAEAADGISTSSDTETASETADGISTSSGSETDAETADGISTSSGSETDAETAEGVSTSSGSEDDEPRCDCGISTSSATEGISTSS